VGCRGGGGGGDGVGRKKRESRKYIYIKTLTIHKYKYKYTRTRVGTKMELNLNYKPRKMAFLNGNGRLEFSLPCWQVFIKFLREYTCKKIVINSRIRLYFKSSTFKFRFQILV